MGDTADAPRVVPTASRWSPLPEAPPKRSWHGVLTLLVPVVVVLGPVLGMYLGGTVTDRRMAFSAFVGLCGSATIYLAHRFIDGAAVRMGVVTVVAVGVGGVVTRVTTQRYGVWMGVGLLFAGWVLGLTGVDAAITRFVKRLGHVLAVVLFIPLALLFVLLPWVVNSIARLDPLRSPSTRTSAWIKRQRLDIRAPQPWAGDAISARPGAWYRVRAVVVWPALVLLVILAIEGPPSFGDKKPKLVAVSGIDGAPLDEIRGEVPVNSPYEGAEWYDQYVKDMSWIESPATAWQPLQPHRIGDVNTTWVNVEDGVRKSWHPPECECKRLKVWLYGGSTGFGLGQRDEHTIASELAREAWRHGIALDVDNRGVVGDVHWQEANRYSWDVATYGPPDLVIFYDGINDTTATQTLVNERSGDRYAQVDFQNDDFWRRFLEQNPPEAPDPLEGASIPDPPEVITDGSKPFVELLMTRYNRSREMSEAISKANGVPTYYAWQPNRLTRPPVAGEPEDTPGAVSGREREAEIAKQMPADVLDLTAVLAGYKNPMFYDDQHHNEQGAQIIGAALYERIKDDLLALVNGEPVETP